MNRKQQRNQKLLRQQAIIDAAKSGKRELTAEEQREFDDLQREIEVLTTAIEAEPGAGSAGGQEGDGQDTIRAAVEAERSRINDITAMCREMGIPEEATRGHIESGATLDAVRAAVIEHIRANSAPLGARAHIEVAEEDKVRDAAVDGILMRSGMELKNPAPGANEFRGMSLRDMAIECLSKEGEANLNRKSSDEIYTMLQRQYFNPSSAFPSIMDSTINKAYVEGHKTVPVTFDRWVKKGSLSDFKTHDNYYLAGPAPELLEVPENGEIKHSSISEAKKPTRKLKTYARQFTLTRQAFINDDVGVITSTPAKYAASARKTQNKQVYQIITGNPVIYDGFRLFGSEHKNLLAQGTGITKEATQAMFMALQGQEDEFGEACIINPAHVIVPVGYKFDMYTLFYSPTINTDGNTQSVNPLYEYRDKIEVIEDPTINVLSGGYGNIMPWWVVGSGADTDSLQIDYLNGQEIPNIRRMEVPGTLGFVWDVYLDWGVAVMDYRGITKNPGIPIESPLALA